MLINSIYFARKFHRLYYNQRRVSKMSQFNLMDDTSLFFPQAPNLLQTLLFIETNRCFPISSTVSIDKNITDKEEEEYEEELSLEQKLVHAKHETISSASLIKKKKVGCTCKKTKCLKMYCQCFSMGKMCIPQCSCYGCSNNHDHLDCIDKAKTSIRAKVLSGSKQTIGKGCNCKRSQCQKKYCECFNAGISCGSDCKCEDCANGSCKKHQNKPLDQSLPSKLSNE